MFQNSTLKCTKYLTVPIQVLKTGHIFVTINLTKPHRYTSISLAQKKFLYGIVLSICTEV